MRRLVDRWGVRRTAERSAAQPGDQRAFVRARPRYLLVEERLAYEQEISSNPSTRLPDPPTGRIRIDVPYDGGACFGPHARDDAERALGGTGAARHAVFGHLVFVEHEETDLDDVLGLAGTYGPYPLQLPISSDTLCDPGILTSDRFAFRSDIAYRPPAAGPRIVPLQVDVELFDPGHRDGTFLAESDVAEVRARPELRRLVADLLKESAEFQPYLTARIRIRLSLPPRRSSAGPAGPPVVRRVRITLPDAATLPLSTVRLHDGAVVADGDGGPGLQIDARAGSFDWPGPPMKIAAKSGEGRRVYRAAPIEVQFLQPGELFRQRKIEVEVDVELPDELASGAQVRFFDATGMAPRTGSAGPLQVRTILSSRCSVVLQDAFGKRPISPSQSFCFEEIVPDAQRVADVLAALVDQRFDIELEEPLEHSGKKRIEHLIVATRRDGPRTMQLWIHVDGRRYPAQRESRQPWGHRYRSKLEGGTLNVHVRGIVHGDARGVTHEINALHLALHDRFQRMNASR
ncbi:MAG TPA: hypothetical protein VEZ42_02280 [Pseudonocardia sp.]|nr:hypothetical protein [Pseudonocardia sp.]